MKHPILSRFLVPAAALLLGLSAITTHAATITVLNANASGAGSLSQAIADANASGAADSIVFDSAAFATPQTITLPAEQTINPAGGAMTITGPGPHLLTLTQSGSNRFFQLVTTGASLTLSGMKLTGGVNTNGLGGGAIKITMSATTSTCALTLTDCIFTNNTSANNGGVIHCNGHGITMNVTDCLFSNNTAALGNAGGGFGGAIIFNGNTTATPITLNFTNTSFIGNTAGLSGSSSGGAIHNTNSPINATFKNCTFHGNRAPDATNGFGGAIRVGNGSTVTLINSTVTGNSAGNSQGGLSASGTSTWTLRNTIVAGNTSPISPDLGVGTGTFVSSGGNLIGNNSGAPAPFSTAGNPNASNDRVGTGASPIVPIVSPPGNHGGTAWTRALLSGSPGIDQGITSPSTGLTTAARGATRIVGSVEDIGAFERSAAAADYTATSLPPGKAGDPYSYTLATGATGFTYTVTNGSLPSPLALSNSSGTVTIAGTPAASGTSTFQITISNGTNDVVVQYQLVVAAGAGPVLSAPTVSTATQSAVTHNSATLGGNVTADGGDTVTDRGIVWGLASNPTTANTKVANGSGTGAFSGTVNGLPSNTLIHVRAYATNSVNTSYGSEISFTTLSNNADLSALTTTATGMTPA
ncbi:MAG: choice-of-anchor Q domain-containing protein, partial [Prosthecobacter sp.]